ncbi:MAG: peptide chain release factor N(5)-glutamine methyltransferase [Paludibacter sp.]|nr:peptide chain release factor N(5)-glutamine methyltransferase [Paludibacter sp.]
MQNTFYKIQSELQGLYPETEIRNFSYLIIEKITKFSKAEIVVNKNTLFSDEQSQFVENFILRLKKFEPIQYILGETEFYGLPFKVNESVLIPRPETEELVYWIKTENTDNETKSILDIGTGSGCIAISLKHIFPKVDVSAYDISEKALETAKINAELNNVNIRFSTIDMLNPISTNEKWDIIVSNPPYVPEKEKSEIQPNVLNHEPHLALFVPDNDPLLFYRQIALFAKKQLNNKGKLYFEIHRDTAKDAVKLLSEMGFVNIELRKDISGNDRMIRAIFE